MKIEQLNILDLVPDPTNARAHDDTNLQAIAGSLSQFGQRKPIVITTDNKVVAGNGTLAAAKSLGWLKIDCVRVPADWSADQVKAFALADNRTAELATWQPEVLAAQLEELSAAGIDVAEFGFKTDDAGMEDFAAALEGVLEPKGELEQITFTLHNWQAQKVREAIELSKSMGEFGDTGNTNSNGNALARIVELWLGQNVS
jgi:ParB-like chromosome segregation protein Spo0J